MKTEKTNKAETYFKGFNIGALAAKTGMSKSVLYRKFVEYDFNLGELIEISKALDEDYHKNHT
jgi:hypothetical protein